MNFDQIETFLTLVKCSSYTKAANELNVTQPAVTKRIANLEEELECKLFHIEKNKSPLLSKEGELFYNYANMLYRIFYDAKKAINLSKKPKIELGFASSLPPDVISQLIKAVKNKTQDIFISVRKGTSSSKVIELIQKNELTLSFVHSPVIEQDLTVEEIAEFRLMIVISQEHPLASVNEITVDLLSNETLIRHYKNNPLWRNIDGKLKDVVNLNHIEVYDFELVKKFVSDNTGFAILPELSIDHLDKHNLIVKPFSLLDDLTLHLYAVYRKDIVNDNHLYKVVLSTIDLMKSLIHTKLFE